MVNHSDIIMKMKKVTRSMLTANDMMNKTVNYARREVLDEAVFTLNENPLTDVVLFGVKDTNQISKDVVEKLSINKGYIFHTVDKMAERGRAIDIDNINPLTGRVMTGSSSCGCINILRGINDLAIGTDGGGSVLAPAISTGLFAIMAKGMGLKGCIEKKSTDNISFTPGIGVISHDYNICYKALKSLCNDNLNIEIDSKLNIAIPRKGSLILPSGKDMHDFVLEVVDEIREYVNVTEFDFVGLDDRETTIELCRHIFLNDIDLILTVEGPVDFYGLGDSVIGTNGDCGKSEQQKGGKYIVKVANMIDATSVTLPTKEIATGIVLTAPKGIDNGLKALYLASKLCGKYVQNDLFKRYFINSYNQEKKGFI